MIKIVVDTNVIISGLISKGYPNIILNDVILEDKVTLLLSKDVLSEYTEVIKRDKFKKYPVFQEKAFSTLNLIKQVGKIINPTLIIDEIKDKSDNKFLELAIFGKAKFLITGNINDFTFSKYKTVSIIEPKEFVERYFNTL